jgi:hypothetical protein
LPGKQDDIGRNRAEIYDRIVGGQIGGGQPQSLFWTITQKTTPQFDIEPSGLGKSTRFGDNIGIAWREVGMKKSVWIAVGLLFCLFVLSAQEIVKNPDKPANPTSGRILHLREIVRLTDESGEFFFKYPRFVKTSPDGSNFILDSNQLIRLDARGKFLGNYFKKGQGPGELNFVDNIDFDGDAVVIHSSNPEKLVWFDGQGRLIRDVSLVRAGGRLEFLFYDKTVFHFLRLQMPRMNDKTGLGSRDGVILSISADGRTVKELASFPNRILRLGGAMMWDGIVTAPLKNRYLAVSHACLKPGLLLAFNRKYERVASDEKSRGAIINSDGTRTEMPGSEWEDDVTGLFAYKDFLWVQTSTRDKTKGILFDVFTLDGKYIDAIFLKTDGRFLGVQGDVLFLRETTPEQTIQIAGYRIIN